MTNPKNERGYYRVQDRVALKIKSVPLESGRTISDMFEEKRREMGVVAQFLHEREMQRPQLKEIERTAPEVARYINSLEDKLQCLAQHLQGNNHGVPDKATHTVDLSASGLKVKTRHPLPPDSLVQITLRLFPSMTLIFVIGIVVRVDQVTSGEKAISTMAIRFTHLHEDDEDLLIRHIHKIQMDGLKVVVN